MIIKGPKLPAWSRGPDGRWFYIIPSHPEWMKMLQAGREGK